MTSLPDTPEPVEDPPGGPFRCAASSATDGEALAGTAPADTDWLFVEYAGSWGTKAVAESRLPVQVRDHLADRPERIQLIRNHGRDERPAGSPMRVFAASLGSEPWVRTALLDDPLDLIGLDPATMSAYDEPLWMVCTNGSRDVCCAERGRPVAAALSAKWPDATWETTHLGGHRFAATLLALPTGLTLGRVDPESAVKACEEIVNGSVPGLLTRGHAGRPAVVQYAEMHLRTEFGYRDVRASVSSEGASAVTVIAQADGDHWTVELEVSPGEPRQASCADLTLKAAPVHRVVAARFGNS